MNEPFGMTPLTVDLEIEDGAWLPYVSGTLCHGYIKRVGNLPNATQNGLPAFQLMATLDDGSTVVIETTWALMRGALTALNARWPQDQP